MASVNSERLAKEILAKNPGRSYTDIETIINNYGIRIYYYAFSSEVSGIFTWIGNQPVIGINKLHPKVRQRFTMAHELYHFLKHPEDKQVLRMSSTANDNLEERQASCFAASLLMPKQVIAASKEKSTKALARLFRVSEEAMEIRVRELGMHNN